MARGGIGNLTVVLGLDAAEFVTGMTKAEKQAQDFSRNVTAFATKAGTALGLAAVAAVAGLAALVKSEIDAADHLNDLSQATGVAAGTLGGIGFAASQAGLDLDSVAAAAGKLNKTLAAAARGDKEAAEAFATLGIAVKDAAGHTKTADVAMAEIATKFAGFKDGPEKSALALAYFGKAGADLISMLNGGGRALEESIELYKKHAGVTEETARKADEFNDAVGVGKLVLGGFGRALTAELLGPLANTATMLSDAAAKSDLLTTAGRALGGVLRDIASLALDAGYAVGTMGRALGALGAYIAEIRSLGRDHMTLGGFSAISDAVKADASRAEAELAALKAKLFTSTTAPPGPALPDAPPLPGNKGSRGGSRASTDDGSAELKKQLDGQLKLIRDFAQAQRDGYDFANRYVEGAYAAGQLSLAEFFATEQRLREANLAAQVAGFDKEIVALKAFQAKATKDVDRIDASNKIAEAEGKRAEAVQKAAQTEVLAEQQRQEATQQTTDRYNDLLATLAQLSGNQAGAEAIRIAQQVRDATTLVSQAGGDPAVVDRYRLQLEGAAALAGQQREYALLLERTRDTEEQIYRDAQSNGTSELEVLALIRDARAIAIRQLQDQAAAAQALAESTGSTAAIENARRLTLEVRKATAELDPLAMRLNGVFTDAFANAFVGFINGTRSAKEAFQDMGNAIIQELFRIAAQKAALEIFGGSGSSGGLGAILSAFMGGSSGSGAGIAGNDVAMSYAVGTNFVPSDGPAYLHRGEAVVPAKYNPAAGGGTGGGPMKLTIVNHTSGRIDRVTEQRVSPTERALIIEEATSNVAAQFHDPNSRVSRAASRNLNVQRKR